MIKVAINGAAISNKPIGVNIYTLMLTKELTKLYQKDKFLLLLNKEGNTLINSRKDNLYVKELNIRPRPSYHQILTLPHIMRYVEQNDYNIIHFPNTMPVYKTNKKVKIVTTIHDLQEFILNKYGLGGTIYRRFICRTIATLSDIIITVSNNSKNDLINYLKIPEQKIYVTYEGIDKDFKIIQEKCLISDFKKTYNLQGADFILAVGEINPAKNLTLLLDAFYLFNKQFDKIKLMLIGKTGLNAAKIHKKVRDLKLQDRVIFTQYLPKETLITAYNAALFSVYPSLYEGFGFPILESMACGCPVITSNISSMPEVAGNASYLFNPRNKEELFQIMKKLATDNTLREKLIEKGILRVKEFNWEECAKKTYAIYQKLLN